MSITVEKLKAWVELTDKKADFLEILRLLLDFDEKCGRVVRDGNFDMHFMRRAVSLADPRYVQVYMQSIGGYMYYIVVHYKTEMGMIATSWYHEDGIRMERDELVNDPGHKIHRLTCVTDLFRNNCSPMNGKVDATVVDEVVYDLMAGCLE